MSSRLRPRVLCVSRSSAVIGSFQAILHAQYEVVSAFRADQAVAFSINNSVAAVVLDSEFLIEHGWTVAQTLKSLHPGLPVLLLAEDHHEVKLPHAVDAIANTPAVVLQELRRFLEPLEEHGT
jgi:DNA-binding NtrC family response regulator